MSDPALEPLLEPLSSREALLLGLALERGEQGLAMARRRVGALLEPDTLRASLCAVEAASDALRATLRERLQRAHDADAARLAPLHDSWLEPALRTVPPGLRERARPWLRQAHALEPHDSPALRWLQARCVASFPRGPTHLGALRIPACAAHPGHACWLSCKALLELTDALGLHALALAMSDAQPRRTAAVIATLPETQRLAFTAHARAIATQPTARLRPLRLRMQSALLEQSKRLGPVPRPDAHAAHDLAPQAPERRHAVAPLVTALGLRLLALAAGTRFDRELAFLAVRLPRELGAELAVGGAHAARRAPALAGQARELLEPPLRTALERSLADSTPHTHAP